MKKIVYILIAILLFHYFAYGQWIQQTSGVTTSLLDIDFINENTGWACGDNGIIVKTTNSGANWIVQPTGVTKRLEGIDAVDANTLYCVGWFQTILKSTTGGTNWIIIRDGPSGMGYTFFKTYFINLNTGWLLRSSGYVLRTGNGGLSFDSTFVPNAFLRDIYFKNALTGVLCADGAFTARSTDGGVSWNQILLPLLMDASNLYRISFIGDVGWTIGHGDNSGLGKLVFRTTNFGSSWDSISRIQYPSGEQNYAVSFANIDTGYAGGTSGIIYKSTNGGFNWLRQNSPSNGFRNDFWFANVSLGWCTGGGGQIYKTTNGGTYVNIVPLNTNIPKEFRLFQNYPNPFNPITNIKFQILKSDLVSLKIYDLLGHEVSEIVNEKLNAGVYEVGWDASGFASGTYFYRLIVDGKAINIKKMILIK